MLQCLKREPGFYRYLWGLTGPIALQNLITFTLGLMDTLMVSWLGNTQMAAVTTANVPVFLLIYGAEHRGCGVCRSGSRLRYERFADHCQGDHS